jgi:serine/threonine protein phosphatase PrpC
MHMHNRCGDAGDSRAVIINNQAAVQPVEDHAPTREDEQV